MNQLARYFDHTNLHADATHQDLMKLCDQAKQWQFAMVAINTRFTPFCAKQLAGTKVHVGAAIGFPLGQCGLATKLFETKWALDAGADEIDYVIDITNLKEGKLDLVQQEMSDIVELCRQAKAISKVIFETCYLTKEEIIQLCQIANQVKPNFVKTSTGFGPAGATLEHVKLMKKTVDQDILVKAAGGIRTLDQALAFIEAGASRLGSSASVQIMEAL